MVLGRFGDVVFSGSWRKVLLPKGIGADQKGRWKTSETPGRIEQSEFIGPSARSYTMEIELSISLGVKPEAELKKLRRMVEKGEVHRMTLGGKPVGKYPLYLESISEDWETLTPSGKLERATVSLSLKEYR